MCLPSTSRSDGAYLPRVRAPPDAGEVVAHRAVDAEQLAARWRRRRRRRSSTRRRGRPGRGPARRCRRRGGDLVLGEPDLLLRAPAPGRSQRHTPGAHLEVHGGGADAGQARAGLGALGAAGRGRSRSWRGRASCPSATCVAAAGGGVGRAWGRRRVGDAGDDQAEQQEQGDRGRVSAAGGQGVHGAVLSMGAGRGGTSAGGHRAGHLRR